MTAIIVILVEEAGIKQLPVIQPEKRNTQDLQKYFLECAFKVIFRFLSSTRTRQHLVIHKLGCVIRLLYQELS